MFCIKCGQEIPDNSLFCPKCGSFIKRPVNQEKPNYTYPNNPYGRQPRGGYPVDGYHSQRKVSDLGQVLLIIAGIWVLLGGIERLILVLQNLAYLRYVRVLGYEFIVVYAVKFGCVAISMFSGIRAIICCGKLDKGKAVAISGIIVTALKVADCISVIALTRGLIDEFTFTWQGVIIGLIAPILLAIGGCINHKTFQKAKGG